MRVLFHPVGYSRTKFVLTASALASKPTASSMPRSFWGSEVGFAGGQLVHYQPFLGPFGGHQFQPDGGGQKLVIEVRIN